MTDPGLKELDDMLPPPAAEALQRWREISRGLWTGIADVRARESINEEKE